VDALRSEGGASFGEEEPVFFLSTHERSGSAQLVSECMVAGIRPVDVPGFIVAQLVGALLATVTFRWLVPALPEVAERVVDPRRTRAG
jgi:hypothetical protein